MPESAPPNRPEVRRLQFKLRGVFALTTWASCTAALAAWRGAGVVVLSAGTTISALNACGRLAPWQFPERRSSWLVRSAWLLLGLSLCLPAARGCSNQSLAGWQTAWACAAAQVRVLDEEQPPRWSAFAYLSMLNLGNLLLALSPLAVWMTKRRARAGRRYAAALGLCAVAIWSLAIGDAGSLLAGYYLWSLSALALLSAFRLHAPTVAAMGALGALLLCFEIRL